MTSVENQWRQQGKEATLTTTHSRVALVTGSGKKRIGWHIADSLAGQGYAIAVHYRTSAKEAAETVEHLRGRGTEAMAFHADLADEKAVGSLFRALWERFGRLDVLVNCAAVYQAKRRRKSLRRMCALISRPTSWAPSCAASMPGWRWYASPEEVASSTSATGRRRDRISITFPISPPREPLRL
jgi:NAD(P)-dependent dehydrogenase (short-subunit alcohol dehydrogenase family)